MYEKGKERQTWIDFAKLLGVLFVMMAHADLRIPMISDFGLLFYVPIFFVIAGYTYHERKEPFGNFVKRKAKRLLLPYFGYSLFLFLFFFVKDCVLPGKITMSAWQPLLGIFYARYALYPLDYLENTYFLSVLNSPLWFLPALFLSLVLFEIGVRIGRKNDRIQGAYVLGSILLGVLLHYICPILLPWSLETVFLLQALIAFGYWLGQKQFLEMWRKNKIAFVIPILLLVVTAMWNGEMNLSVGDFGRTIFIGMFNAALSSAVVLFLCYRYRDRVGKGLQLMGRSSLCIMALHMFVFMFIKAGFNIVNPAIMLGDGMIADFAKILMICITLAVLTIINSIPQMAGESNYE